MTTDCIRKVAREVLRISLGRTGGHKRDWWWNAVIQGKVEANKAAYLQLVGSTSEEERRANSERYKVARKEAKMAVMTKTATFPCLYEDLGNKGGEKKLFRLSKTGYKGVRDAQTFSQCVVQIGDTENDVGALIRIISYRQSDEMGQLCCVGSA
ncbi:uncharacterized protein LOC142162143 [Nicotiana tabacum]|uniref:Uncharacterized protein LOC142162143 n=1 Tax=Nicotiana tabacum TaxID=4097 RepID=A0AC58RPC7_TOBAC